jgi:hypothetical protein
MLFRWHSLRLHHVIAATILFTSAALMLAGLVLAGVWPAAPERVLTRAGGAINWVGQRLRRRNLVRTEALRRFAGEFSRAAGALWTGRRRLARPILHIILFDGLQIVVLYLSFRAFPGSGPPIGPTQLVAIFGIGVLFSVVAITPQGVGAVEGTMIALAESLGLPMGRAVAVILAYRVCGSETSSARVSALRRVPDVLAQQPAQLVPPPDRSLPATSSGRHRRPLVQPLMRPRLVVVLDVDGEDMAQVGLRHDQQVVEALPPHRPHPPLRYRVRRRGAVRRPHDLHPLAAEGGVEAGGERAVAVVDEVAGAARAVLQLPAQLPGLLGHPRGGRVGRAAGEPHPPRAELDKEQDVDGLEEQRFDREVG